MGTKSAWKKHQTAIIVCDRCPRLRAHCRATAELKKREFRDWTYWGKPVPGFGGPDASIWVVGLAPAAHGANRTGRMFTGDSSGNWLYRALAETGFATQAESTAVNDGQKLNDVYISAAARCAPPDNKPSREELLRCEPFLDAEWQLLTQNRIILALGKIALDAVWNLARRQGEIPPALGRPRFAHGLEISLNRKILLASYHPSRQNTQTGRLTWPVWKSIFTRLAELRKSFRE